MYPKACWILCTPRTGSSYLCELLNNLGSFPIYHHQNMKTIRGPLEVGQTFNEWSRLFSNIIEFMENPPPYSKMIFHQYIETMAGMAKQQRYNVGWYPEKHDSIMMKAVAKKYDSRFVKTIFPDIKYIHLTREPISHAISLYFARSTKQYHIYDQKTLDDYLRLNIKQDQNKLKEAYFDALSYASCWADFLHGDESIINVKYENLINDPRQTLLDIVSFLNIKGDVEKAIKVCEEDTKRIFRMTRPEAPLFEKQLKYLTMKLL